MDYKELDVYVVAMKKSMSVICSSLEWMGGYSPERYSEMLREFESCNKSLDDVNIDLIFSEALSNTDSDPHRIKHLLDMWRLKLDTDDLVFEVGSRWNNIDTICRQKLTKQGLLSSDAIDFYVNSLSCLINAVEEKSLEMSELWVRLEGLAGDGHQANGEQSTTISDNNVFAAYPIEVTQIFESKEMCYECFSPKRELGAAEWGRRMGEYGLRKGKKIGEGNLMHGDMEILHKWIEKVSGKKIDETTFKRSIPT